MTDKLRALTEDPELRALMEQYYAEPAAGRGPFLQALNEKADALYPGWQDRIERSRREGVHLRAKVIQCVRNIGKREDLSKFDRSNARDAEVEFKAIFEKAAKSRFLTREDAFMLAEATQVLTAAAGLEPEELRSLNEKVRSDLARTGGTAPKREKSWIARAKKLAFEIHKKHPTLSNGRIAEKILEQRVKEPGDPGYRTLAKFVAALRANGTLPSEPSRI